MPKLKMKDLTRVYHLLQEPLPKIILKVIFLVHIKNKILFIAFDCYRHMYPVNSWSLSRIVTILHGGLPVARKLCFDNWNKTFAFFHVQVLMAEKWWFNELDFCFLDALASQPVALSLHKCRQILNFSINNIFQIF